MEINQQQQRKFRRLNLYVCKECGHPRGTLVYRRQQDGLCRKCARDVVPENQPSLFFPGELIATDTKPVIKKDDGRITLEVTAKLTDRGKKFLRDVKKINHMDKKQLKNLNKQALGRGDYENKKLEKDIIKIAFGRKKKLYVEEN